MDSVVSGEGVISGEGVVSGKGGEPGETSGPKSNYVNYDIAQSVLVSSRDAGKEVSPPAVEPEEEAGSKTPTG